MRLTPETSTSEAGRALPTPRNHPRGIVSALALLGAFLITISAQPQGCLPLFPDLTLPGVICMLVSFLSAVAARRPALVLVPTVLFVVTLTIANHSRPKGRTNESAAVANLRTINTAQVTYLSSSAGSYGTITDLIDAKLLDDTFSSTKAGYNYSITLNATGQEYTAEAVPASVQTGRYNYYSVPDAVVRYGTLAPMPAQVGKSVQ
jgi:hypothetical protein